MQTFQQLQLAVRSARQLGYQVRFECLDGLIGGACQIRGKPIIFVDLTLTVPEQLQQITRALAPAPCAGLPTPHTAPTDTAPNGRPTRDTHTRGDIHATGRRAA